MTEVPHVAARPVPPTLPGSRAGAIASASGEGVPLPEHEFFVEEFRGITIVVALPLIDDATLGAAGRTVDAFRAGDTRFVFVVPADRVEVAAAAIGGRAVHGASTWNDDFVADLWLTVTDAKRVVVGADPAALARTAGAVSTSVRASKMVLTDPGGGWGTPPRSYADIDLHGERLAAHLAERGLPDYAPAAQAALVGGAYSVNLCRAEDLAYELLTFDGRGTVLTHGRYLHLTPLQVDDFARIESLVGQGVREGILKPRSRAEIARMAAGGLGARVLRTGHLAGVVGLEVDRYAGTGYGEVSGLITVAEFSGLGAGSLLIDGLFELCRTRGLTHVFAVTVSDSAADFFARRGFREVGHRDVPATKWEGYDAERLAVARCFLRPVENPSGSAPS
ncbi:N-acetylglutamate synthase (plasmid) [Tsukamurella tyrosinosolvens]|uniref:N-acetylglutamate synthase, GNAT family n=1 Tax=Tsukamurella tyrosinosolvens TaxID=57704 RepID=A0A1H4PE47_TSUTY|nr:GNAT family N-acetyltransferase [Tsukamurella tyrosinosolvens]SEC05282.1 N-acetylglutamate synthase, GNAT family [Tsukamurella tyrosinosolvens]VEH97348.1 N-acetylglutamate synthase [Tsukamurella tyrosinosolvens]